jgi:nucleotide-binding universal stress UspA family protein
MPKNNTLSPVKSIFVVLDPTRMAQPSLQRAEWIAERNKARLHLYCCVYDPLLASEGQEQDTAVELASQWLERLAAGARAKGLEVSIQIESDPEWRDAISVAASDSGCDLIVKTASLHGPVSRRLMKTADWTLISSCPRPVLLVNPISPRNTKVVLAAVKLKPSTQVHVSLNEQVVDRAHQIADSIGAELHAATVYKGDEFLYDRQKFADSCKLPRNRVHAVEGAVTRGIAEVAAKIGAGVVIVGSTKHKGGAKSSEAARYLVDELRTADVVVLPAT